MNSVLTNFILLTAGKSSRMGSDKSLLEYHGHTWIENQAREIESSECIQRLILVDQPGKSFLYERLMSHCQKPGFRIDLVENPQQGSQPMDSILLGLNALNKGDSSFISPVDVPLCGRLISRLCEKREPGSEALKPSYHHKGGHPIWLSATAIEKFKHQPRRLDEFLAEISVQHVDVSDSRVTLNLNTPEDWQAFVNRSTEHQVR